MALVVGGLGHTLPNTVTSTNVGQETDWPRTFN